MDRTQVEIKQKKRKWLKIILWILFPYLIAFGIFCGSEGIGPEILAWIFLTLGFAILLYLFIKAERYYNWPFIFLILFCLGFYFKRQHWPLGTLLISLGVIFLCATSLVNSIRFQITIKNNPFLKWFGSITCFIVATYMLGWLFMVQNWPREIGDIFSYTGVTLFIISILGMVFTLPGSNYIGWTEIEKKIFFRAILVPMVFVFGLILIVFIFNDFYFWILKRDMLPWNIYNNIELLNLEGIPKI